MYGNANVLNIWKIEIVNSRWKKLFFCSFISSPNCNCVRRRRTRPLISVGCPVQLIGEFFWDCICVTLYLSSTRQLTWSFVIMRSCLPKALYIFFLIVGAALATVILTWELVSNLWPLFTDETLAIFCLNLLYRFPRSFQLSVFV